MAAESSFGELSKQWDSLRSSDEARRHLIEHLFNELKLSHEDNKALRGEIKTLKFHERNFVEKMEEAEQKEKELSTRLGSIEQESPFLLVLVDGDNTHFHDEFVRDGAKGGYTAAQKLQQTITSFAVNLESGSQCKIVVRIYTNMFGLCGAYEKSDVSIPARVVRAFIGGFNRELPLAEFVDVGDDKEAADLKIKENLALYWSNQHCKHILLAASADKGYVGLLRQFSTASASERLTLVESIPFPEKVQEVAARFKQAKFKNIFREDKIVCTPPYSESKAAGNSPNYAAAAAASSSQTNKPSATAVINSQDQTRASRYQVPPPQFNKHGQRIDPKIRRYDNSLIPELESRNLCGRHFLTRCTPPGERCPYGKSHNSELSDVQRLALVRLARQTPCKDEAYCRDACCVAGHHCLYDENCFFGQNCKFGTGMHGIDKTPVSVNQGRR